MQRHELESVFKCLGVVTTRENQSENKSTTLVIIFPENELSQMAAKSLSEQKKKGPFRQAFRLNICYSLLDTHLTALCETSVFTVASSHWHLM